MGKRDQDTKSNGSWIQDKEPLVIFELYQMETKGIMKAKINREGFVMEVEMRQDGFYYLDEFLISKEDVRFAWKGLDTIDRLRAEAQPISYIPHYDWVILKSIVVDAFKKTKLLIPDGSKEASLYQLWSEMPMQGIVVAVGPGFYLGNSERRPVECEVGDHIIIEHGNLVVSDFVYKGQHYYTCRAGSVIGHVPEEYTNSMDLKLFNP